MAPAYQKIVLSLPSGELYDNAGSQEFKAPDSFLIFAYGTTDTTKGEYKFDSESAASVMGAYRDSGNRLTVDYEHQALSTPPVEAPAAASFIPQLRADGLYATDVKWTPRASEMLRNKEYLYYSPAFKSDKEGRPERLLNVALTNLPATKNMESLVAANQITKEKSMNTVLTALSLKEDASEAEALSLVMKLNDERKQLLSITGANSSTEALATLTAWKQSAAEVSQLREKFAAQETARLSTEFDAVLEAATVAGVIPPSEKHEKREFALSLKGKEDGISALKKYIKALGPAVPSMTAALSQKGEPESAPGVVVLTKEEKHIAKQFNISHKELAENKARRLRLAAESAGNPIDDEDATA